jgi:dethiobiotin synthetase
MTPKTLLVAGSGWGVGKTVTLAALLCDRQTQTGRLDWGLMKLIQCGGEDNAVLADWLNFGGVEMLAPLKFPACLDPALAAAQAEGDVALAPLWRSLCQMGQDYSGVLIEGVGSLSSAITPQATLADVAADWKLPVLLVAAVRPSVLAELLAQAALARQAGCDLRGIVLNCVTPEAQEYLMDWAPPRLLEQMTGYPVLGKIPYLVGGDRTVERLARVAAELDLHRIWP